MIKDVSTDVGHVPPTYDSVILALPLYKQFGLEFCNHYEAQNRGGYSWNDITPHVVYNSIVADPWSANCANEFARSNVGKEMLFESIKYFIGVRCDAEYWADILADNYRAECAEVDGTYSVRGADIDGFIGAVAEREWRLNSIVEKDPILHSFICLETSRKLELFSSATD